MKGFYYYCSCYLEQYNPCSEDKKKNVWVLIDWVFTPLQHCLDLEWHDTLLLSQAEHWLWSVIVLDILNNKAGTPHPDLLLGQFLQAVWHEAGYLILSQSAFKPFAYIRYINHLYLTIYFFFLVWLVILPHVAQESLVPALGKTAVLVTFPFFKLRWDFHIIYSGDVFPSFSSSKISLLPHPSPHP